MCSYSHSESALGGLSTGLYETIGWLKTLWSSSSSCKMDSLMNLWLANVTRFVYIYVQANRGKDVCHCSFDWIAETERYNHLDTVASGDKKYLLVLSVIEGNGLPNIIISVESIAKPETNETKKMHILIIECRWLCESLKQKRPPYLLLKGSAHAVDFKPCKQRNDIRYFTSQGDSIQQKRFHCQIVYCYTDPVLDCRDHWYPLELSRWILFLLCPARDLRTYLPAYLQHHIRTIHPSMESPRKAQLYQEHRRLFVSLRRDGTKLRRCRNI